MVELIPGKLYKIERLPDEESKCFWAGLVRSRILTGKRDSSNEPLTDYEVVTIPNESLLLYIGPHYYDHNWGGDNIETIGAYLFIYKDFEIIFRMSELDKNNRKNLTIQVQAGMV